jgi:acetyl-CoA acetyltransferase
VRIPVNHKEAMPGSVITGGACTPIGKLSGALKNFQAVDLGGLAIKAALEKSGLSGDQVDYVIMGHVIQAGPARSPPAGGGQGWYTDGRAGADGQQGAPVRAGRYRVGRPAVRSRPHRDG